MRVYLLLFFVLAPWFGIPFVLPGGSSGADEPPAVNGHVITTPDG